MSEVTVIVKPRHGKRAGWNVHHFAWDGPEGPPPDIEPIEFQQVDDKFEGKIEVAGAGGHCLAVHVTLGTELEVDLEPHWKLLQPAGQKWPNTVSVPGTRTQWLKTLRFQEGNPQ